MQRIAKCYPMKNSEIPPRGLIKIIRTPKGTAPTAIRENWIGLELPCLCHVTDRVERNVLTNKPEGTTGGFIVLQREAIDILFSKSLEVATWWRLRGYPTTDNGLWFFDDECAEVIRQPPTGGDEFVGVNS